MDPMKKRKLGRCLDGQNIVSPVTRDAARGREQPAVWQPPKSFA